LGRLDKGLVGKLNLSLEAGINPNSIVKGGWNLNLHREMGGWV